MDSRTSNIYLLHKTWLVAACLFMSGIAHAQEKITELDEVEVVASEIGKFGVGANITTMDSTVIGNYEQASLATLLGTQSTLYIKQYGQGMLASASFRGTGAGHTIVRWNGLQVGYPFLGQSDFSVIPLAFTNQVILMHGASSARYGTGAIGGAINLQSTPPARGTNITLNQSLGSFGTSNSFVQFSQSSKKGYVRIGGMYNVSENDFPSRSETGAPLGKQANAGYAISGGVLEGSYFLSPSTSLHLNVQATFTNRNLQPAIGSTANDNQKDGNLWTSLAVTHLTKTGELKAQYGYLSDRIDYNGSVTNSYQHVGTISFSNDLTNWLVTDVGINTRWVEVITPNYDEGKANETRAGLYASVTASITNRLKSSLSLRQTFVTGFEVPFTPSIGLEYALIENKKWNLDLLSQVAKGYKVPTLNDRFWVPGGNPNLLPEESMNAELGIKFTKKTEFPLWIHFTGYKMWVDNWILWLPQGALWSPVNKRKVEGDGIELEMGTEKKVGMLRTKYWLNYAFTKSTNVEALDTYDRSAGKQLPYVPYHNGNINVLIGLNGWSFLANAVFTGKRFTTTDNENKVPGYILLNASVSRSFVLNHLNLRAYLNVNNVTNTNYQSVNNRAMLGIYFQAGVKINFNSKDKTQ